MHLSKNFEKALGIYDEKPPVQLDIQLFEIGGALEILGDASGRDKCHFYERAKTAFDRQLPLIQGDSYTAYGKTIPLEGVSTEIRKHINETKRKCAEAGVRHTK